MEVSNRICRGRPVCRPANVFRETACPGGHIGPPLRDEGGVWELTGIGGKWCLFQRAGRSPPPTGGPGQDGGGVRGAWLPPYGCNAGGAQRRADVPKAWPPPTKFRAEIWGVGHGHRSLRGEGEVPATTRASGAQRSVCGADGRNGWKSEQRSPQKCLSTPDNPSVTAFGRASSLCTREPLGAGDADCRVALRASSQ